MRTSPHPLRVPTMNTARFLGVREIRALLSVTDRWIRRAVAAGRFPRPALKLGRGLRWRAEDVERFIAENKVTT